MNLSEERKRYENLMGYLFIAAVIAFSYGFEIFNFHLMRDEEWQAVNYQGRVHELWLSQGRWGMSILNYFVLQNPIGPAVPLLLGLIGTAAGLRIYLNNQFAINSTGYFIIVALAITTPTLVFIFAFKTISYGIGFAFLAIALSHSLIHKQAWWAFPCALLLAAFALGVYQTFIFALAMIVLTNAVYSWDRTNPKRFLLCGKLVAYFFGSAAIYLIITYFTYILMPDDPMTKGGVAYVGSKLDILGLFNHSLGHTYYRIITSFEKLTQILGLQSNLFGEHSFWLAAVLIFAMISSLVHPILRKQYRLFLHSFGLPFCIVALMVFADALSKDGALMRTMVYIPVGIAIIVAHAYGMAGTKGRAILASLSLLAIIGNSMVDNHLHLSSANAEFNDRIIALDIIKKVEELDAKNHRKDSPLKIEIIGRYTSPTNALRSVNETIGASFFTVGTGNDGRAVAYLILNGLKSELASDEEGVEIYELQKAIPAWPSNGWIALFGDIVVLKFSNEYTLHQKNRLCKQGVSELC